MTAETKSIGNIGFVDTFEKGHFTGWNFNNTQKQQKVSLRINGWPIRNFEANMVREDVKKIGIPQTACGFDLSIDVHDLPAQGCILSFHDPIFGTPLGNGVVSFHSGKFEQCTNSLEIGDRLTPLNYVKLFQSVDCAMSTSSFLDFSLIKLQDTPDVSFVAMSYLLVLGRTPDPEGFANSLKLDLSTRALRRSFLLNMISSTEFKKKRSLASATADLKRIF